MPQSAQIRASKEALEVPGIGTHQSREAQAPAERKSPPATAFLSFSSLVLLSAVVRVFFFLFGLYQDAHLPVPYTDIDYLVFSDAAQYVYSGLSPYRRATYRYPPLLAWLLYPNHHFYSFGKLLFIVCDLLTGVLIHKTLTHDRRVSPTKALGLTSVWLLNPMVITISTRGSSESVLSVLVMLFVYCMLTNRLALAGVFVGVATHLKIYPIIYIPLAFLVLLSNFWRLNRSQIRFLGAAAVVFVSLTLVLYRCYGHEFLYNSYLYHLVRIDHRHNFSVFNPLLYFKSAVPSQTLSVERLAFLPQLLLSGVFIPVVFAKTNFSACLFLQTFAFVMGNKVITSQYFIWFLCFLPLFLRHSKLLGSLWKKGAIALGLWVGGQALWLFHAYQLEFLGYSTFYPGLFLSSLAFYVINVWILGVCADDVAESAT